ncbi:MAG: Superoxide dismutase [Parcubacteria group bacterium GW2011_GWB1_45_10]|nr:MAG: Superoxide dismutase [Parcubacteria group bacterium GW2011_GWB1_45_10]
MTQKNKVSYQLPKLNFAYDALEPFIDARTMEIHYSKHHQAYVDKLNAALEKHSELFEKPVEELLKNLESIPEDIRTAVRNHGGGHFNHSFFWEVLCPLKDTKPVDSLPELKTAIEAGFGNFEDFKQEFLKVGLSHFGSGWAWLSKNKDKKLLIHSLLNQDSPLSQGLTPIFGVDLWEHAYYLKYQNRRQEYLENIWQVVNWQKVLENLKK